MSKKGGLDARQLAHARSGAYLLLADLLAEGPRPELLRAAEASSLLAPVARADLDELAADHQHVFGFCAPPLEGLLLDPEGNAGGLGAERVAETYTTLGYEPDPTREEPEHLATQLRALALLCGAEADALEDGRAPLAAAMRDQQRHLLDAHLLRWVPLFVATVQRIGRPFPTALVTQLDVSLRHHRDGLGAVEPPTWQLAEPLDLDDPEVGLREIARYLTTPARAGVFLSRHDLTELGRALRLPRGFGGRTRMMHQLLTAAARFDGLGALAASMEALVARSDAAIAPWGVAVAPWRARSRQTGVLLARLGSAALGEGDRA